MQLSHNRYESKQKQTEKLPTLTDSYLQSSHVKAKSQEREYSNFLPIWVVSLHMFLNFQL